MPLVWPVLEVLFSLFILSLFARYFNGEQPAVAFEEGGVSSSSTAESSSRATEQLALDSTPLLDEKGGRGAKQSPDGSKQTQQGSRGGGGDDRAGAGDPDVEEPSFSTRLARLLAETSFGVYVFHCTVKAVVHFSFTRLFCEKLLGYRVLLLINVQAFGPCAWGRLYTKDTTEVLFPPAGEYGVMEQSIKDRDTPTKSSDPNFRFPSAGLLMAGWLYCVVVTMLLTLGLVWAMRKIPGVKAFL